MGCQKHTVQRHVGWEGLGYVFKQFITDSKKNHQLYQNSLHLKTSPTANSHSRASQTQAYQTEIWKEVKS